MKLALFVFLALIPSIASLNCYECNSLEDATCANGDSLPQRYLKTCNPQRTDPNAVPYCRKIDQTVNGEKSVVRSCGAGKGNKDCYKTAGVNSASVCSCNADACNAAPSIHQHQPVITIISSFFAIAIAMIYLR